MQALMRSNLSSGFLKLLSIQTGGGFLPFLSTLPHKTSWWWSSQSCSEHLVPSSGNSILSHPVQTLMNAIVSQITVNGVIFETQWGCISYVDLHGIKSNVLVNDQGAQKRNFSMTCCSSIGAQILLASIPNCWLMLHYAFWAMPTSKRISIF